MFQIKKQALFQADFGIFRNVPSQPAKRRKPAPYEKKRLLESGSRKLYYFLLDFLFRLNIEEPPPSKLSLSSSKSSF